MDRNSDAGDCTATETASLSARRAWIEMFLSMGLDGRFKVALRKESVDRNIMTITICTVSKRSLSARRAWIEMLFFLNLVR